METPTCQVSSNVLLLLVWTLRCNNQKDGETNDPPSESAQGGFGSGKDENRADDSFRIGKNTFNYHDCIIICTICQSTSD